MACLTLAIVYETHDTYPQRPGDPADYAVEYEPEETIALLEAAVAHLGHRPLRVGSPHDLLRAAASDTLAEVDAALSIAEGYGSRNREAWVPGLLEMLGIPRLGSDGLTLSLSLDKAWTNRWVAAAGVRVPPGCLLHDARDAAEAPLPCEFPLFVKPRWEGTAKGIRPSSRVTNRKALAREVERIAEDYGQAALVEAFVPGAEFTVTVVGNDPPRPLPVLQRALDVETGIGLHAVEGGGIARAHEAPGQLDAPLEAALQAAAVRAYEALECLDFARADFRLTADGQPVFLEINPLPTFAPDGTFGILAELEGRPAEALVADVIAGGLRRLGLC